MATGIGSRLFAVSRGPARSHIGKLNRPYTEALALVSRKSRLGSCKEVEDEISGSSLSGHGNDRRPLSNRFRVLTLLEIPATITLKRTGGGMQ